MHLEILI